MYSHILIGIFILYVCYKMLSTQNRMLEDHYKAVYISELINPVSQWGQPLTWLPSMDDVVWGERYINSYNKGVLNNTVFDHRPLLEHSSGVNSTTARTILTDITAEDLPVKEIIRGYPQ